MASLHASLIAHLRATAAWQRARLLRARGAIAWLRLRRAVLPPAGPGDHRVSRRVYAAWLRRWEPAAADIERLGAAVADGPLISVLMPVFDPHPEQLREALDSVRAQTYPHWQLCVCDDASQSPAVRALLARYAAAEPRLRLQRQASNGGIGAATAAALALADGAFVAFLDHDDCLPPYALQRVAEELRRFPETELLYSDEDKLDRRGRRCAPHFKPDWNPDLLAAINYIGHLLVIRRSRVLQAGGIRGGFDGSQDYDLVLRCTAGLDAARIRHVPAILYHWRGSAGSTAAQRGAKPYAHAAGRRALSERFPGAAIGDGPFDCSYRLRRALPQPPPSVGIVIPTRDGGLALRRCLESIREHDAGLPYQLLIVDNQSRDPTTLALLDAARRRPACAVIGFDREFNFSAINNHAVAQLQTELLLLLNDDVEVCSQGWLAEMAWRASEPGVGVVGAKLHYPSGRIQHAGVILGVGGVAGHSHKYFKPGHPGYFGRLVLPQTLSAVTGACLMVRRDTWQAVGGLDEQHLGIAFNDVDFCLRVGELGLRTVWTPFAQLVHHESRSRGLEDTPQKQSRFGREVAYMQRRWGERLRRDPHYSPYLTRQREDFSLSEAPPLLLAQFAPLTPRIAP